MVYRDIQRIVSSNECAGCGKVFAQILLTTPFCIVTQRFCEACVEKEDRKEKAIKKQQEEKSHKEWLRKIGIKEQYEKATLDNYKPSNSSQYEALEACRKLNSREITKLVLLGSNGVGKTHLASALVKYNNGLLITAYEMFATYRACFSANYKYNELEIIKRLSEVPLLAIDEFGRTKGSEAEENFLSVVIDNRHSNNLPTLILSNLIRKRDCVFFDPNNTDKCKSCNRNQCLESRITKDVLSRLRENSNVILINGEDYRKGGNR